MAKRAQKPAKPNGQFVIEKGIPVPQDSGSSKGYAAVLRRLEIGDSVLLPGPISRIAARAVYALGQGNYKARTEGTGTRVWRTA